MQTQLAGNSAQTGGPLRAFLGAAGARVQRILEERFPYRCERWLADRADDLGAARLEHPGLARMAALRVERAGPLRLRGDAAQISAGDVNGFGRQLALGEHFDWTRPELLQQGLAWRRRLHAFPFAIALAEAHDRSAALAPRETLLRILHGWHEAHPVGRRGAQHDAWHAPTTAERLLELAAACALLDLSPRDPDRSWISRLLAAHVVWLQTHGSVSGAGLLREHAALAIAAEIFAGGAPGPSRLDELVAAQFVSDGAHVSACPRTHALALCDLLDVAVVLDASTPRWLHDVIARAAGWLESILPDGGHLPLLGASWRGDVALDLLLEQARRLIKPREPSAEECAAPAASGVIALRSDDVHAVLRAASPRDGAADGPAHADALSFSLWFGARTVVDEAGGGCLDAAPDLVLAADARSHATLLVGRSGSHDANALRSARAGAIHTGRDGDVAWAWASETAPARGGPALVHHRLLAVSPVGALVLDVLLGGGRATVESGLPLDPDLADDALSLVPLGATTAPRATIPRYDRPGRVRDLHRVLLRTTATLPCVTGWLLWRGPLSSALVHARPTLTLRERRVTLHFGEGEEAVAAHWDVGALSPARGVRVRLGRSGG